MNQYRIYIIIHIFIYRIYRIFILALYLYYTLNDINLTLKVLITSIALFSIFVCL